MTRPTRMLIVLGLFGVGAVVVLSMMAQRYGKVLRRVERSQAAAPARPGPVSSRAADPDPGEPAGSSAREPIEIQVRALRSVDAFIAVRRALLEPQEAGQDAGTDNSSAANEEGTLVRALAAAGLDRASYDAILELYTAWKAGRTDLSGPLPAAFAQRAKELERLE